MIAAWTVEDRPVQDVHRPAVQPHRVNDPDDPVTVPEPGPSDQLAWRQHNRHSTAALSRWSVFSIGQETGGRQARPVLAVGLGGGPSFPQSRPKLEKIPRMTRLRPISVVKFARQTCIATLRQQSEAITAIVLAHSPHPLHGQRCNRQADQQLGERPVRN